MTRSSFLLSSGLIALTFFLSACNSGGNTLKDCPPCPNNTVCLDGDCGCSSDQHDMKSWCLSKHENLFVAASLDCPCLDIIGLYLLKISPETGNNSYPASQYSIAQPRNPYSGTLGQFAYYEKPDGDSVAIYNIPGPGSLGFYACAVNDSLTCEMSLFGKFHGPDTIETKVVYWLCRDKDNNDSNYSGNHHLTFIRKK